VDRVLPEEGQARAVRIDIDPEMLGIRYPIDAPLHGDARLTLRALIPLLNVRKIGPGVKKSKRTSWKTARSMRSDMDR
jgi:pyruvate dehydrogenase (quinone)